MKGTIHCVPAKYREEDMRIKEHPILEFNQKKRIILTIDGKELEGYKDEPGASALVAVGIKVLSRSIKHCRQRICFGNRKYYY